MTSNNSSQNVSSCSTGGSDSAAGGGGGWLGFSLSPRHMAASIAAAEDGAGNGVQQQHHHAGGLYYPPVTASSPAPFCYALGSGGQDTVATQAGDGGYYSALSSMPLRSDGSLCITEAAFRRGDEEQQHHGEIDTESLLIPRSNEVIICDGLGHQT